LGPHQLVDDCIDAVRRHDPAPQQVADVGTERVDLPLLTVECERVVATALLDPERLVETPLQLFRFSFQSRREVAVTPDFPRELSGSPLRVVDVALDLTRRYGRLRQTAVVEAL